MHISDAFRRGISEINNVYATLKTYIFLAFERSKFSASDITAPNKSKDWAIGTYSYSQEIFYY